MHCLMVTDRLKVCNTHRIVLQGRHIGLDRLLHVVGGHQRRGKVDVAVNEVWLESHCMPIVLQGFL